MESRPSSKPRVRETPPRADHPGDARRALTDYFSAKGLSFSASPTGEILIPFDTPGRRLVVVARIGEQNEAGVTLQLVSIDPIAREHWAATLVAVNRWNDLVPCPRAVLRAANWDADSEATLTLDAWLPYGSNGVDPEQLEQLAAKVLAASSYFATAGSSRTKPTGPAGSAAG